MSVTRCLTLFRFVRETPQSMNSRHIISHYAELRNEFSKWVVVATLLGAITPGEKRDPRMT